MTQIGSPNSNNHNDWIFLDKKNPFHFSTIRRQKFTCELVKVINFFRTSHHTRRSCQVPSLEHEVDSFYGGGGGGPNSQTIHDRNIPVWQGYRFLLGSFYYFLDQLSKYWNLGPVSPKIEISNISSIIN